MATVTDPVCGMSVDTNTAAGTSSYQGKTYYFCSAECVRLFNADPGRYASKLATQQAADARPERHEPPFTKSGGVVAPKFGSAGSGGAEYERLPEAHDKG